ncbi:TetR/AcrR family transcriptional regulator [Amycolatopsis sp. NPDC058986]|uniref:TetR/AcrR family transcriptional regulator n=1 Tax=unclassified Amycolatopsis TaxID=2618356 RepID=UPI0036732651
MLREPQRETPREPQQERSRTTRRRLVEAAVDCLAERGWNGVTVGVIAERAGVSRGAAQHHFRTREDLVAAAVEMLGEAQIDELRAQAADVPEGASRFQHVVDMVLNIYTGTMFRAALQLWVVASTDASLRATLVPLEARVGREAHRVTVELLGVDESRPGVRELVQATLDLGRGLGLANLLTDDTRRRRRVAREWAHTLEEKLAGTGPVPETSEKLANTNGPMSDNSG